MIWIDIFEIQLALTLYISGSSTHRKKRRPPSAMAGIYKLSRWVWRRPSKVLFCHNWTHLATLSKYDKQKYRVKSYNSLLFASPLPSHNGDVWELEATVNWSNLFVITFYPIFQVYNDGLVRFINILDRKIWRVFKEFWIFFLFAIFVIFGMRLR